MVYNGPPWEGFEVSPIFDTTIYKSSLTPPPTLMGPSKALHRVARITGEQQVLHTYYADHVLRPREVHREFSREQRMGSRLLQFEPYVFILLSVASYTSAFKSSICPYTPCFLAQGQSKPRGAETISRTYLELDQTSSSSSVPIYYYFFYIK